MFLISRITFCAAALSAFAFTAQAEDWVLDGGASSLAFGSIKKDSVGESHRFGSLSGQVGADGYATLEIDLSSIETNIDIRNERMIEHVFKNVPTATVTAEIDMSEFNETAVGESVTTFIVGTLYFLGADVPFDLDVYMMRLTEDKVMVTTDGMFFVAAEDAGINPGIDKLMELAELPSITRASPVTFRLMFDAKDIES